MTIKSPKNKGSAGEREAIDLLTKWSSEVGVDLLLERNLEQVRHGGSDINGVPGLEIEVKRVEATNVKAWWAQVCKAAERTGNAPFLMHRANRKQWQFRVRVWVWPCRERPLDVDLTLPEAQVWFKAYLMDHKGEQNVSET